MIPIPIIWSKHVAKCRGSAVKHVPCEFCGTEYVYVLTRSAKGSGISPYLLNETGARQRATAHAVDALKARLETDYDPVPCPACGNYQRYMFTKLYTGSLWVVLGRFAGLFVCCSCALGAALSGIMAHLGGKLEGALPNMALALTIGGTGGAVFVLLGALDRARERKFDPNTAEGQPARLALARQRAITRAEFDVLQALAHTQPPAPGPAEAP